MILPSSIHIRSVDNHTPYSDYDLPPLHYSSRRNSRTSCSLLSKSNIHDTDSWSASVYLYRHRRIYDGIDRCYLQTSHPNADWQVSQRRHPCTGEHDAQNFALHMMPSLATLLHAPTTIPPSTVTQVKQLKCSHYIYNICIVMREIYYVQNNCEMCTYTKKQ